MIDELDQKLLGLLKKDALQSSESLAKQLNTSSATVRRRMNKLIDNGILRIVGLVDSHKVGYPVAVCITLRVSHDRVDGVVGMLAKRPEIKWLTTAAGRFDILAFAVFRSTQELSDFFKNEMSKMDGVGSTETSICLEIRKGRYMAI